MGTHCQQTAKFRHLYTGRSGELSTDIVLNTNALKRNNNSDEVHPKSNKSIKWKNGQICKNQYGRSIIQDR
jgi:hypothetical protein